jgi:hypothetical protein
MTNKLFLISLLFLTLNSKAQSGEKFMKLQRVFSIDTSFLANRPLTGTGLTLVYQQNIPANKLWIVKNINFTTNGSTSFENNNFGSNGYDLSIAINNTPIIITGGGGGLYLKLRELLIKPEPLIISSEKNLQFYTETVFSGLPVKYRVHIYFSVEEYIVE